MNYLALLQTEDHIKSGKGIGFHTPEGVGVVLNSIGRLMVEDMGEEKIIDFLNNAMIISYYDNRSSQAANILREEIRKHYGDPEYAHIEVADLGTTKKAAELVELVVNAHEGVLADTNSDEAIGPFKLVVAIADKPVLQVLLGKYIETYLGVEIGTEKGMVNVRQLLSANCIIADELDTNGRIQVWFYPIE